MSSQEITDAIWEAINVLDHFYKANLKREEQDQIPCKEFYNEVLNKDINLQEQYDDWAEQKRQQKDPDVSYVNVTTLINYPWIFDCFSKSEVLFIDSRDKMKGEIDKDIINNLLYDPFNNHMD